MQTHARASCILPTYIPLPECVTHHPGTCLDPHVSFRPHQVILVTHLFICLRQDFFRINSDCRAWGSVERAANRFQGYEHLKSTQSGVRNVGEVHVHTQEDVSTWRHWVIHASQQDLSLSLPPVHREGGTVGMTGSPAGALTSSTGDTRMTWVNAFLQAGRLAQ